MQLLLSLFHFVPLAIHSTDYYFLFRLECITCTIIVQVPSNKLTNLRIIHEVFVLRKEISAHTISVALDLLCTQTEL